MIRINLRDFNESSFPIFPCYCSLVVSWLLPSCIYCSTIGGVCSKMTRTITLSIILYWTILLEIIPESTSNKTTLWNKSQRREGCFRQNVTGFFWRPEVPWGNLYSIYDIKKIHLIFAQMITWMWCWVVQDEWKFR